MCNDNETNELLEKAALLFTDCTPNDTRLLRSIGAGEPARFDKSIPSATDTSHVVNAETISRLCTDLAQYVPSSGIEIHGAVISGRITLDHADIGFSLVLKHCVFTDELHASYAKLGTLQLTGSRIPGIDMRRVKVNGTVSFDVGFECTGPIRLTGATINGDLIGTGGRLTAGAFSDHALDCSLSTIIGSVYLTRDTAPDSSLTERRGFESHGVMDFRNARIRGSLDCNGARIVPKRTCDGEQISLLAQGIHVYGAVYLSNGFHCEGAVNLIDACIDGNLECNNAEFINPGRMALDCERIVVNGDVFFCRGHWRQEPPYGDGHFRVEGEVKLVGAKIEGSLECKGGVFSNPGRNALVANTIAVQGNVFMYNGFRSEGKVSFVDAKVLGNMQSNKAEFVNENDIALDCERASIGGDVFLCNGYWGEPEGEAPTPTFSALGEVKLVKTSIGGSLECKGGQFCNPGGSALLATGAKVQGSVFLYNGFCAKGPVGFVDAEVKGNFQCNKGVFDAFSGTEHLALAAGPALNCERLQVGGDVFFCNGYWGGDPEAETPTFRALGGVKLVNAVIGGNIECRAGQFINQDGNAFLARGMKLKGDFHANDGFLVEGIGCFSNASIAGVFTWKGMQTPASFTLDLLYARIAVFRDDQESWPDKRLMLDGFTYDLIIPTDLEMRRKWLRMALRTQVVTQPYSQLASVLRGHGLEHRAKQILMDRQKALAKHGNLPWPSKVWSRILGWTIGYGYRPTQALWWLALLWVVGLAAFSSGDDHDFMVPTDRTAKEKGAPYANHVPSFDPALYSLDAMIPLINLQMENHWTPKGGWPFYYYRAHIALGWMFSTLAVIGFTGIVRKE